MQESAELRDARRNFRRLARRQQLELVHELSQTAADLLHRAYPALVSVGAGFRQRRPRGEQTPRRVLEPCVIFVVVKKWRRGSGGGRAGHLPRHLLAYATVDGHRVLCAAPTDVQPRCLLGSAVAHGTTLIKDHPYGVGVDRDGEPETALGVVCCGIRRPVSPGEVYLLSCRHVFGRELLDGSPTTRLPVLLNGGPQSTIALTTRVRGRLAASDSCDTQLALVTPPQNPAAALEGLRFDGPDAYVRAEADIDLSFWVHTGRVDAQGRRLRVRVQTEGAVANHPIGYATPAGVHTFAHRRLLRAHTPIEMVSGDSGSPATSRRDGGVLVGMYIGGSDTNAYFIPAWQLFTPRNYGAPGESGWTLT